MKDTIRKILTESSEIRVKQEIPTPKSIHKIHEIFKDNGFKLYLVGGAVRDTLMGRNPKDFDLATDAVPDKVKEMLPMYPTIESGEQFAVVNVVTEDDTYEIATFREDVGKGRRPDEVKFSTIDKDVLRRDLTINALFYDLDTNEIVDLVGGISDLENGIVRTVGKAEDRFDEDKLRILRALRFAGRVGVDPNEDIDQAIKKDNSTISGDGKPLAQERIQDEFVKGIKQTRSSKHFIGMVEKYDLMKWVFGDMNTSGDVGESRIPVVVIATILRNELTEGLDKKLTSRFKFTKLQGKQIKFLIDFLRDGTPDTAFEFKTRVKNLHMDGNVLSNFGKVTGMDKAFIKAFIKYEITTDGGELVKQGFKGKAVEEEKGRIETELFKITMGKSIISYSGIVLDGESRNKLVSLLPGLYHDVNTTKDSPLNDLFKTGDFSISKWTLVAHHMTVTMGPLYMKYRPLLGQDFNLTVTHIGYTDDVVAVKIDTSFEIDNPHVTLATSPNGTPDMSRHINNWSPITPFNINGTLEEIPHEHK
jgi:tRNA nucleotidyltransferase/poly(A) polymerase